MIYLDNAATSFPKPQRVIDAVVDCLKTKGANPGRGAHQIAMAASRVIFEAREALAGLFNVDDSSNIIFTLNATDSLNLGIKGLLKPGDHAITTSMEHNSVSRPLNVLSQKGVLVTKIHCDAQGHINLKDVENAINAKTKLIITTHASNVTGTLMPLAEITEIAHKKGILYMVDAAQTAGAFSLDVQKLGIDILACSGHKALLGPQGTGVLYIGPHVELEEIRQGGTGGYSEDPLQPRTRPDQYESGTPNTPGIAGLGAAVKFIEKIGVVNIREKEDKLTRHLLEGLKAIKGVNLHGPTEDEPRAPVISFNIDGAGCHEVAFALDKAFKIASRSGLHCAPDAHRTIGTLEEGTVRLSIGYFNTEEEIDMTLEAINHIAGEYS
jgi:cysteine desulfurase family protein